MIQEFVTRYYDKRDALRQRFEQKCPGSYLELVTWVVEEITSDGYEPYAPDPERIHEINDGAWQGTLLYIIAEKGYQPEGYYVVRVAYGSCSGCDTLLAIQSDYDDWSLPEGERPESRTQAVKDLETLALHIVQGIREI